MARGYCFGIDRYPDDLSFEESDLYHLVNYEKKYASNLDATTSQERIQNLIEMLERIGAEVGTDENTEGETIHWFAIDDEVKRQYFVDRFVKVKQMVSEISLDDFAIGDPYTLRALISDEYADAISWDGSFLSLDYFIREADNGVKYFLSNQVVLMH